MSRNNNKLKRIYSKNDTKQSSAKRQYRNENEKRRRDLFNQLITNLEDILSNEKNFSLNQQSNKLDKSSILHQTVEYLQKSHQDIKNNAKFVLSNKDSYDNEINDSIDLSWKAPCNIINIDEWFKITIESMNCFLLVIKCDEQKNSIVYISNHIKSYIGYEQNQLINQDLFQFIHPNDHDILHNYLLNNHHLLKILNLSWKTYLHDYYEYSTIIGAFRYFNENEKYLISIVKFETLDRTLAINDDNCLKQFQTHINIYGKFIFIDFNARQHLGYSPFELIGQTYFDFVHPDDLSIIVQAHHLWKLTGNGQSEPYRFLTKGQQWIYVQTNSQVQINSWTGKPDHYICTTNILQHSKDYLQRKLSFISTDIQSNNSNIECSPVCPQTSISIINSPINQDKICSSENEIRSFLTDLRNENCRKMIRQKLIERQQIKEDEIRFRQEEIQVIQDIIQYIDQYELKHSTINQQTTDYIQDEYLLNILDPNWNTTLFNSPFTTNIDEFSLETNSKDEQINDSLFSSSS